MLPERMLSHILSGRDSEEGKKKERERQREGALLVPFIMAFPPLHDTREMTDFVRESFRWR